MVKVQNPNLEILKLAIIKLGEVSDEMVFIGGCAVGLLITDKAAPPIRVTRDVDAIVQVATKSDYYKLSDRLRNKGFHEDSSDGAPLCRWVAENVILDVMPTDSSILGFGNQWYQAAMTNAVKVEIGPNLAINLVSSPYFLITKLEAFNGRGNGDFLSSHDIEDFIAVLDGRTEIRVDVANAPEDLVKELSVRFGDLLNNPRFLESVSGHLPSDVPSQARVPKLLKLMESIVNG